MADSNEFMIDSDDELGGSSSSLFKLDDLDDPSPSGPPPPPQQQPQGPEPSAKPLRNNDDDLLTLDDEDENIDEGDDTTSSTFTLGGAASPSMASVAAPTAAASIKQATASGPLTSNTGLAQDQRSPVKMKLGESNIALSPRVSVTEQVALLLASGSEKDFVTEDTPDVEGSSNVMFEQQQQQRSLIRRLSGSVHSPSVSKTSARSYLTGSARLRHRVHQLLIELRVLKRWTHVMVSPEDHSDTTILLGFVLQQFTRQDSAINPVGIVGPAHWFCGFCRTQVENVLAVADSAHVLGISKILNLAVNKLSTSKHVSPECSAVCIVERFVDVLSLIVDTEKGLTAIAATIRSASSLSSAITGNSPNALLDTIIDVVEWALKSGQKREIVSKLMLLLRKSSKFVAAELANYFLELQGRLLVAALQRTQALSAAPSVDGLKMLSDVCVCYADVFQRFCADSEESGETQALVERMNHLLSLCSSVIETLLVVARKHVADGIVLEILRKTLVLSLACLDKIASSREKGTSGCCLTQRLVFGGISFISLLDSMQCLGNTDDSSDDLRISREDSLFFGKPLSSVYDLNLTRSYGRTAQSAESDFRPLSPTPTVEIGELAVTVAKVLSAASPKNLTEAMEWGLVGSERDESNNNAESSLWKRSLLDAMQAIPPSWKDMQVTFLDLISTLITWLPSSSSDLFNRVFGPRSALRQAILNYLMDRPSLKVIAAGVRLLTKLYSFSQVSEAVETGSTTGIVAALEPSVVVQLLESLLLTENQERGGSNKQTMSLASSSVRDTMGGSISFESRTLVSSIISLIRDMAIKIAPSMDPRPDWSAFVSAADRYGCCVIQSVVRCCSASDSCEIMIPLLVEIDLATANSIQPLALEKKYGALSSLDVATTALKIHIPNVRLGLIGLLTRWMHASADVCDDYSVQQTLLSMVTDGSPQIANIASNPVTRSLLSLFQMLVLKRTLAPAHMQRLTSACLSILNAVGGETPLLQSSVEFVRDVITSKQLSLCKMEPKSMVSQLLLLPVVNHTVATRVLVVAVHAVAALALMDEAVFDLLVHDTANAEAMFTSVIDMFHVPLLSSSNGEGGGGDNGHLISCHEQRIIEEVWEHVKEAKKNEQESHHQFLESRLEEAAVSIRALQQKYEEEIFNHERTKANLDRSERNNSVNHDDDHRGGRSGDISDLLAASLSVQSSNKTSMDGKGHMPSDDLSAECDSLSSTIVIETISRHRVYASEADDRIALLSVCSSDRTRIITENKQQSYKAESNLSVIPLTYDESIERQKVQLTQAEHRLELIFSCNDDREVVTRASLLAQDVTRLVIDRAVSPYRSRDDTIHQQQDQDTRQLQHGKTTHDGDDDSVHRIYSLLEVQIHCADKYSQLLQEERNQMLSLYSAASQETQQMSLTSMAIDSHHVLAAQLIDALHTLASEARLRLGQLKVMADRADVNESLLRQASLSADGRFAIKSTVDDETAGRLTIALEYTNAVTELKDRCYNLKALFTADAHTKDSQKKGALMVKATAPLLLEAVQANRALLVDGMSFWSSAVYDNVAEERTIVNRTHRNAVRSLEANHADAQRKLESDLRRDYVSQSAESSKRIASLEAEVAALKASLIKVERDAEESVKNALEGSGLNDFYRKNMELLKSMQQAKLSDAQRECDRMAQQLQAANERHSDNEQQLNRQIAALKVQIEDQAGKLKLLGAQSVVASYSQDVAVNQLRQQYEALQSAMTREEAARRDAERRASDLIRLHQTEVDALMTKHRKLEDAAQRRFDEALVRQQADARTEAAHREQHERVILEQNAKESAAKAAVLQSRVLELENESSSLRESATMTINSLKSEGASLQQLLKSSTAKQKESQAIVDELNEKFQQERRLSSTVRETLESDRITHHLEVEGLKQNLQSLNRLIIEKQLLVERQTQKLIEEEQKNHLMTKKLTMIELEDQVVGRTRGLDVFQSKSNNRSSLPHSRPDDNSTLSKVAATRSDNDDDGGDKSNISAWERTRESAVAAHNERMEAASLMAQYAEAQRQYHDAAAVARNSKVEIIRKLASRPSSISGVKALSRSRRVAWDSEDTPAAALDVSDVKSRSSLNTTAEPIERNSSVLKRNLSPADLQPRSGSATWKEPFDPRALRHDEQVGYQPDTDPHLASFFKKKKRNS